MALLPSKPHFLVKVRHERGPGFLIQNHLRYKHRYNRKWKITQSKNRGTTAQQREMLYLAFFNVTLLPFRMPAHLLSNCITVNASRYSPSPINIFRNNPLRHPLDITYNAKQRDVIQNNCEPECDACITLPGNANVCLLLQLTEAEDFRIIRQPDILKPSTAHGTAQNRAAWLRWRRGVAAHSYEVAKHDDSRRLLHFVTYRQYHSHSSTAVSRKVGHNSKWSQRCLAISGRNSTTRNWTT